MSGDRTFADPTTPASDLMHAGLRVGGDGRYELLSKLGEGGMGSVWRAKDLKLKREVAIKRIRGATSPALQERFLRETRALTGLSHPNVVTVFDAGEDAYGNYLVMELVSGKTLAQRLKEGPIDPSQAVDLFCAMCRGMSHAHKRGVIHRDLKPSNVMLNDDGVARILDFGLVRLEGSGDLSLSGVGMGTLDYASPEQRQDGGDADERSDVFALGLVFYEMLTGKRPVPLQVHKVMQPWRDVIARATEQDPGERHASMDELLTETESARSAVSHEDAISQAMGKDDDLRCPKCRLVNTLEAKFCRACRESLRQPCPACDAQVRTGLKHCDQCTADIKLVHSIQGTLREAPQRMQEGQLSEAVTMLQALQPQIRDGAVGDVSSLRKQVQKLLTLCGEKAQHGRELAGRAAALVAEDALEEAKATWEKAVRIDSGLRDDAAAFNASLPGLLARRSVAAKAAQDEFDAAESRMTELGLEQTSASVVALRDRLAAMPQAWAKDLKSKAEALIAHCSSQASAARAKLAASRDAWQEREYESALQLLSEIRHLEPQWSQELMEKEQSVEALRAERDRAREVVATACKEAKAAQATNDLARARAGVATARLQFWDVGAKFAAEQGWVREVDVWATDASKRFALRSRTWRRLVLWSLAVLAVVLWVTPSSFSLEGSWPAMLAAGLTVVAWICHLWMGARVQRRLLDDQEREVERCKADSDAAAVVRIASVVRQQESVIDAAAGSAVLAARAELDALAHESLGNAARGVSCEAQRKRAQNVYAQCLQAAVASERQTQMLLQAVGLGELRAAFSESVAWQEWCQRALGWDLSEDIRGKIRLSYAVASLGIDIDSDGCYRHVASDIDMVWIAPGSFDMGSASGESSERPVHRVHITRPFLIGKTQVTQAQYRAISGHNASSFRLGPDADRRPVETLSWNDAVLFCEAMSKAVVCIEGVRYSFRLPTEAEWEYCCRAGTATDWHTGSSLSGLDANFADAHMKRTVAVGGYNANAWGLFDMHGNVWEWCLDSWDRSANYPSSAVSDPCVARGAFRVLRGGSWNSSADYSRSAFRSSSFPGTAHAFIGFRVVLAPVLVQ